MKHDIRNKVSLKQLLYLDPKVVYSLLFKASQALVGVLTILIITHWFKPADQGYYYTFASLLALQVILELGLSFVILQFTGHEFATLSWSNNRKIEGPDERVSAFKLFLIKGIMAYSLIAIATFCLVWPIGYVFFSKSSHVGSTVWNLPWLLLCLATSVNIITIPFLSIIEGSGRIIQINQFRTIQNTLGAIAMWIAMMLNANLYSIAIDPLICFVITALWLNTYYPDLLKKTYHGFLAYRNKTFIPADTLKWRKEIWPMQWRIAISWISGYFISQIYTPIVFYYHDAASAGQLGMSMAICNMLSLFAIAFITAYNPEMCQLIANKKWQALHQLFKQTFFRSLALTLLFATLIIIAMLLPILSPITHRLVSPFQMLLLLTGTLINYIIGAVAILLRAFKREPFMLASLIGAILNATFAWYFGMLYSITGIALVFVLLNLFYGLPTTWFIWRKNTNNLWPNTGRINIAKVI